MPERSFDQAVAGEDLLVPYAALFGDVPAPVRRRIELYAAAGRNEIEAIETGRSAALAARSLEPHIVQLLQFAIAAALGLDAGTRLHGAAAARAGATLDDLIDAAQIVQVVAGMARFGACIAAIADLADAGAWRPVGAESDDDPSIDRRPR
jgi:alkylhydroperoxidase/carboxymuconolactone decarboxylase family protein YurZ